MPTVNGRQAKWRLFEVPRDGSRDDDPVPAGEKVTFSLQRGVLIVNMRARELVSPLHIYRLKDLIFEHLPQAKAGVVVDCSSLTDRVSSELLGMLLSIRRAARKQGCEVTLCGVQGVLCEALEITNIEQLLPTFKHVEDALFALGPCPQNTTQHHYQLARARYLRKQEHESQRQNQHPPTPTAAPPGAASFARFRSLAGNISIARYGVPVKMALSMSCALVCLGLATYSVAMMMPAPSVGSGRISGQVTCVRNGVVGPDAGALIVVWPVAGTISKKLAPQEVDQVMEGYATDAEHGPIARVRAREDGRFQISSCSERELHLLVISANARRMAEDLPLVDQLALTSCLDDPQAILQDRAYQLTRCWLPPRGAAQVDIQVNVEPRAVDPSGAIDQQVHHGRAAVAAGGA